MDPQYVLNYFHHCGSYERRLTYERRSQYRSHFNLVNLRPERILNVNTSEPTKEPVDWLSSSKTYTLTWACRKTSLS
jgi:hypothetical protein